MEAPRFYVESLTRISFEKKTETAARTTYPYETRRWN